MNRNFRAVAFSAAAALAAAHVAVPTGLAAQEAAPTYAEHVAPILQAHCVSCHRPGEVAPFSLLTYQDARKRGRMLVRVTRDRLMPPWQPVAGHGDFEDELRLPQDAIDKLAAWVAAGAPEGDPQKAPPQPEFGSGWQLGEPDMVVQMPAAYEVPAGGPDIYRNFVVPLALKEDAWVTAIDVRPTARAVLHHVLFGFDSTGRARERDGQDGKPGYYGMAGGSRRGLDGTSGLGGWAVGGRPKHLPMGLAFKLPAGADLVLQSHFHPSGKAESEQTKLALYFTQEPPAKAMHGLQLPPMFGVAAGIDVPPGESDFVIEDRFTVPVDAQAVTVGGHAHMICREMQVHVTPPGGERRSVFLIDDWDFDWQNRYQYREPLDLPAGAEVEVRIVYDNSTDNPNNPFDPPRRIRWGLQSTDEMGSVTLLLVAQDEGDSRELARAIRNHRRGSFGRARGAGAESLGRGLLSRIWLLDRDQSGTIEASEIPKRYQRWVGMADTNKDGKIDKAEMDAAAKRLGRGRR